MNAAPRCLSPLGLSLLGLPLLLSCSSEDKNITLTEAGRPELLRHLDLSPATVLSAQVSVATVATTRCWVHARVELPASADDAWLRDLEAGQMVRTKADFSRGVSWAPWFQPPPLSGGRDFGEGEGVATRVYRRALVEPPGEDGRAVAWMERMTAGSCSF